MERSTIRKLRPFYVIEIDLDSQTFQVPALIGNQCLLGTSILKYFNLRIDGDQEVIVGPNTRRAWTTYGQDRLMEDVLTALQ